MSELKELYKTGVPLKPLDPRLILFLERARQALMLIASAIKEIVEMK